MSVYPRTTPKSAPPAGSGGRLEEDAVDPVGGADALQVDVGAGFEAQVAGRGGEVAGEARDHDPARLAHVGDAGGDHDVLPEDVVARGDHLAGVQPQAQQDRDVGVVVAEVGDRPLDGDGGQ